MGRRMNPCPGFVIGTVVFGFVTFTPQLSAAEPGNSSAPIAIENGDTNGDWDRDLSDAIYLLDYLFTGGRPPAPLACGTDRPLRPNGDANGDRQVDVSDAVYFLGWLFRGGREPVPVECVPAEGSGAAAATQRSIDEFVAAQGTECILPSLPPGTTCADIGATEVGGCCLFVPPIENFFGWTDPSNGLFTSIDYAGEADDWISGASGGAVSFGTTTTGSVTERPLADGRAEIHVRLHTTNALSWAFIFDPAVPGNPFANTPLVFGNRAPEILADGAEAALGESLLHVVFTNNAPGAPLPDLGQLVNFPQAGQALSSLSFYARADGPLHELFGVPEGTSGRLQTTQTGLLDIQSKAPSYDGFPAEHVNIQVVGN